MQQARIAVDLAVSARATFIAEQVCSEPATPFARRRRNAWHALPLCRMYLVVAFVGEPVTLEVDGVAQQQSVIWGFGSLADGQHEVLGAWPKPVSGEMDWPLVLADLAQRGVESVGYVLSNDLEALGSPLSSAYPRAKLVPALQKPGAFGHRSRAHHRAVLASGDAMLILQREAVRAVNRHGSFSSLTDATAFTADALGRAEERIKNARSRVA